jgi:hypothetical protein
MSENQAVTVSSQQTGYGFLNLFDWQRHLVGLIIQIRHLTHRPQLLQDSAELWRTIRIGCPAKSPNAPVKIRMGEYVSTAPERLVIRVGDDNGRAWTLHRSDFIQPHRAHCFLPNVSRSRR